MPSGKLVELQTIPPVDVPGYDRDAARTVVDPQAPRKIDIDRPVEVVTLEPVKARQIEI
jgi:hypothetical protein